MLLFCLTTGLSAALAQVSGAVTDAATGEPIIGAGVIIKGTNTGTATGMDGRYALKLPAGNTVVVVSSIGYQSQTIDVAGKTQVDVQLKEDALQLEQVVVIGYGVQKKSDLTGAVASINTKEIGSIPVVNVSQALQGKASGIEIVQNSGAPGSSVSVRIRGMGTINNSDPLYVVDGIPMDDINFLSSDDVASMEVLKDASSAAIYGSRAANGVVLITTKSGKESERVKLNFNTFVGLQEAWREPDIMSPEQYVYFYDYASDVYTYTKKNDDGTYVITDNGYDLIENGAEWWKETTRRGLLQKYNLSLAGGSKSTNYYISGTWQSSDGIVKESNYTRKAINAKMNTRLLKNVSLTTNLTLADEDRIVVEEGNWGIIKTSIVSSPLTPLYNPSGGYTRTTPVEILNRSTREDDRTQVVGALNLDVDFLKHLKFTSRVSANLNFENRDYFEPESILPNSYYDGTTYKVARRPATAKTINWENVLTFAKTFGDHDLLVLAGQTLEDSNSEVLYAEGYGRGGDSESLDAFDLGVINQRVTGYSTGWSSLGFLGRINYSYKNRYLLQTNFRADGSSRFENDKWGIFPSASAGWKISEEAFMEGAKGWLPQLKIRAGWGQLGNNRIGNNTYATTATAYKSGSTIPEYYVWGVGTPTLKPGLWISTVGNPDIKWERTTSTNVGLDFALFDSKISGTVDAFVKKTTDMLIAVPVVYSAGFLNNPMQNAGDVTNTGVELSLTVRNSIGDFRYEITGNFTKVKNEVTKLGENNEPIYGGSLGSPNPLGYVNKTAVGTPIAMFYGWKTDGVFQSDAEAASSPTFKSDVPWKAGDRKYVDINGDGVIDDSDRTYIGSPHPDFYYGFNFRFEYKGFDLSCFWQGVYGNDLYNVLNYFTYTRNSFNGYISNSASDYFDQVWRPSYAGNSNSPRSNYPPNYSGMVPAPSTDANKNNLNFVNSDFYIEDGSYLRLKNIQLGWTVPNRWCEKMHIGGLKVYVAANNLFTFTAYKGLDPEVGKAIGTEGNNLFIGIDQGTYPQARTYMFGVVFDL